MRSIDDPLHISRDYPKSWRALVLLQQRQQEQAEARQELERRLRAFIAEHGAAETLRLLAEVLS